MFGLFKKKGPTGPAAQDRIVRLLEIFERLSAETDELYTDAGPFSRAEVRLFAMSAVSLHIQVYGGLDEAAMQEVVNKFSEQAIASLLIRMPRADYGMIHDAFRQRFAEYADFIFKLSGPMETSDELQTVVIQLMPILDRNARVDRPLFVSATEGLKIKIPLTMAAADVQDVFRTEA